MPTKHRKQYDYEITIDDHEFDNKPFVMPDNTRVYASATVVIHFDAHNDSCDYPNNTREEWVEICDWKAEIDIHDLHTFDLDGDPVEATEEMRKWFEDDFDLEERHKELMLEEVTNAAERHLEDEGRYDD